MVDRWKESDRRVDCSTFAQRCVCTDWTYTNFPIGIDEVFFPIGREFDDYATHQHRYKLVEHVGQQIIEYMAISWEPINVAGITKNRGKELIPIWARIFNFVDKQVSTHYFVDNICDILNEVWVMPSMSCSANTIREAHLCELERAGEIHDIPQLVELVNNKRNEGGVSDVISASDEADLNHFFELGKRLMPLVWDKEALVYPWIRDAVVSGKWAIPKPINYSYYSRKILDHRIEIDDLRPVLDDRYSMHMYTRKIPAAFALTPDVRTNFGDELNSLIYTLNKFIEQVPYTEFKIKGIPDKWESYFGNCYFDLNMGHLIYDGKTDATPHIFPRLVFNNIMHQLLTIASSVDPTCAVQDIIIIRSFNEDVYITIMYKNGNAVKLYSDLVFTTLGSRGLFTDYECSWFNQPF